MKDLTFKPLFLKNAKCTDIYVFFHYQAGFFGYLTTLRWNVLAVHLAREFAFGLIWMLVLTAPLASGRTSTHQDWCVLWSCYWGTAAAGKSVRKASHCSPPSGCCSPGACMTQRYCSENLLISKHFTTLLWHKLQCNLWALLCYFVCNLSNYVKVLGGGGKKVLLWESSSKGTKRSFSVSEYSCNGSKWVQIGLANQIVLTPN